MNTTELNELAEQFAKDLANSDVAKRVMVLTSDWPDSFNNQQQSIENMLAPLQHLITIIESKYTLTKKK